MSTSILLKSTGALCILCSSTAMGYLAASRIRARQYALEDCLFFLITLKQQLVYTNSAPRELIYSIQGVQGIRELDFVTAFVIQGGSGAFKESWRDCVFATKLPLKDTDKELLAGIGEILGCYDLETQEKHIELLTGNIKLVLDKLRSTSPNEMKLTQTLSILAGLFIAIIAV